MDINFQKIPFLNRVKLRDKAFLARQMATMLSAGVPLDRSLRLLGDRMKNLKIKEALYGALKDIEGGLKLSQAMARYPEVFGSTFVSIIIAGETSGKLDEVMERVAGWMEEESEFSSRLANAMIYPLFIIGVMIVVVFLMMTNVIPKLKEIFESYDAQMPTLTNILINVSLFCRDFWYLIVIAVVGIVWWLTVWELHWSSLEKLRLS